MANRKQQGVTVIERRLRPVYDWLDVGNNKKALQEVEKVLKKTPTLHCAKALKCLANIRLGKEQEALELLDNIVAEQPADDATLQAMKICYREVGKLEKICDFYEAAVKKDPSNEELHTHLFMSYVRTSNFEKQQRSATALYKMKPKNPYYFWAIMSIVLQVTKATDDKDTAKKNVLLTLAQRMVDKFITENKLEAEQEVQLYIMILELQNKHDEALEFLQSPIGRKLMPGSMPQASLSHLKKLERWSQLNTLTKQLIWNNMDRWDYYLTYIQSCIELIGKKEEPFKAELNHENEHVGFLESIDDTPERCNKFLQLVSAEALKDRKTDGFRGPQLAIMELYKKFKETNINTDEWMTESLPTMLLKYFKAFGHKGCCVSDMKAYMLLLSKEEGLQLADEISTTVGVGPNNLPHNEAHMQLHISAIQICRMFGKHHNLSVEHIQTLIVTYALHCEYASYRAPRSPTERVPADQYGLIAAHLCYDLAMKTKSSKPLIEAIYLLEYVVENSPSNYHCKLFCIKLYHLLGSGLGAQMMYDSLDIKQIQLDSLGYVHCAQLFATGLLSFAKETYRNTIRFFTNYYKESVDHLTYSYKFGSFMKLEELMECRERLLNSLHGVTVHVEHFNLALVLASSPTVALKTISDAHPTVSEDIKWDNLRDNRDLSVNTSWDPIFEEDKQLKEKTFQQDKVYLKIKATILRCLIACTDLSTCKTDAEFETNLTGVSETLDKLKLLFKEIAENEFRPISIESTAATLPSRIVGFSNSRMPLNEAYVNLFEMFLTYAKKLNTEAMVQQCTELVQKSVETICEIVKVQSDAEDGFWDARKTLEQVVNFAEMISFFCCIINECHQFSKQSNNKKNKKKGSSNQSADLPTSDPLLNLVDTLTLGLNRLAEDLGNWVPGRGASDLASYFATLSIDTGDESLVLMTLRDSHTKSIAELQTVLRDKVKYLSSLGIKSMALS